ncbi:matrixin family metalloprotease [Microbacterium sp. NPDC055683]
MAAILGVLVSPLAATPASAYVLNGCKWNSTTININPSGVPSTSTYMTGFELAVADYHNNTQLNVYKSSSSTNTYTAAAANYGQTGWAGRNEWNCPFSLGLITASYARLNSYYLSGSPSTRLKVFWEHELGHGFGLAHTTVADRVMHTFVEKTWNLGVRGLTTDDINGINYLY